ncbi:hypothetical protein ACVU7I_10420 [Patulibacter sp. S7RM1-6]
MPAAVEVRRGLVGMLVLALGSLVVALVAGRPPRGEEWSPVAGVVFGVGANVAFGTSPLRRALRRLERFVDADVVTTSARGHGWPGVAVAAACFVAALLAGASPLVLVAGASLASLVGVADVAAVRRFERREGVRLARVPMPWRSRVRHPFRASELVALRPPRTEPADPGPRG